MRTSPTYLVRSLTIATLLGGLMFTVEALVHVLTGGSAGLTILATATFGAVMVLAVITLGAVAGVALSRR